MKNHIKLYDNIYKKIANNCSNSSNKSINYKSTK